MIPSPDFSKILSADPLTTRRGFLKSGLASSVATAALGIAVGVPELVAETPTARQPSRIVVSSDQPSPPLRKPWKNTIATGNAHLLLRADLQSHLAMLQETIGYRYVRCHGLFHDDMAVAVRRGDGTLGFRWTQVGKILDGLLKVGLRPHIELSSMPIALASGAKTVFDWDFNVTPPRSYAEWGQLVEAFARHCLDRYGLDEIAEWYYEVWNEPNIDFWAGSQEEYWKLYDASAFALKSVSQRLRVGGPVTARAGWIRELISHCSKNRVPLDFISTHIYVQDFYVNDPNLRIDDHPPGMFVPNVVRSVRDMVQHSEMPNLEVKITEWNSEVPLPDGKLAWNHNPSVDNSAAAATACDLAIAVDEDCDTFCWWVASDVFEEGGMPQSEFSGTFGLLTLNGLPKATFNAFAFMSRLRGERLNVHCDSLAAGCGLVATAEGQCRRVLLWTRILQESSGPEPWEAALELPWTELGSPVLLQERITAGAGSCYETWLSLGAPQTLSPGERRLLESHAVPEARLFLPQVERGRIIHDFRLAPGEVLYLELRPKSAAAFPNEPLRHEIQEWYAARSRDSR